LYTLHFLLFLGGGVSDAPQAASLSSVAVSIGLSFYVYLLLLGAGLISFFVSHVVYLGAVGGRPIEGTFTH
jgi:uncharacterized membrane protein YhhN